MDITYFYRFIIYYPLFNGFIKLFVSLSCKIYSQYRVMYFIKLHYNHNSKNQFMWWANAPLYINLNSWNRISLIEKQNGN